LAKGLARLPRLRKRAPAHRGRRRATAERVIRAEA
jgi:hypothetical protein